MGLAGQFQVPAALSQGMRSVNHFTGGCVRFRAALDVRGKSRPRRFPFPVASRYTDYGISSPCVKARTSHCHIAENIKASLPYIISLPL